MSFEQGQSSSAEQCKMMENIILQVFIPRASVVCHGHVVTAAAEPAGPKFFMREPTPSSALHENDRALRILTERSVNSV